MTKVEVIFFDETEQQIPIYYYRGKYWLPGEVSKKYAMVVKNKGQVSIEIVVAMNGVDLNRQVASISNKGLVLDPRASTRIESFFMDPNLPTMSEKVGTIGLAVWSLRAQQPPASGGHIATVNNPDPNIQVYSLPQQEGPQQTDQSLTRTMAYPFEKVAFYYRPTTWLVANGIIQMKLASPFLEEM